MVVRNLNDTTVFQVGESADAVAQTNTPGSDSTYGPGLGTGNAAAASLLLQGATIAASGTAAHSLVTGIEITGNATAVQMAFFGGGTPVVLPAGANQAALTNSTTGTYNGTLVQVSGSGDDATINDNFTDVHTLLDEIRTALVNLNLMKGAA